MMHTRPKKSLGQVFLESHSIAKELVNEARLAKKDFVIEIGPGKGILTFEMLSVKKLVLLEKDIRLSLFLKKRLKSYLNVYIINTDALIFPFSRVNNKIKVISNLPYNISTEVLFRLIAIKGKIEIMLLMFQKEVADRIVAVPNSKKYSPLSIIVQYNFKVEKFKDVKKDQFQPVPKVDSSILKLIPHERPPYDISNKALYYSFIKRSFASRRKTLKNNLKSFIPAVIIEKAFKEIGITVNKRPEQIEIKEFIQLFNCFKEYL